MKIIVIDKNMKLLKRIKQGLEKDGLQVSIFQDGIAGHAKIVDTQCDMIIIGDVQPGIVALSQVKKLRTMKITKPIIMLSAKDKVDDIVAGLAAGADDAQPNSISIPELAARVSALHRRAGQDRGAEVCYADLRLDPIAHRVWRNGSELELTGREYDLFEYFMRHPGKVLSRVTLGDDVWKGEFAQFTNIIDVYVNYLRKKIEKGTGKKMIHTVRKVGYRFGEG